MKVNVSEQAARKVLGLIPATTDPELVDLRQRLETGLQKVTDHGVLQADELKALIWAAALFADTTDTNPDTPGPARRAADQLKTAGPKLEAMLARRQAEAGT